MNSIRQKLSKGIKLAPQISNTALQLQKPVLIFLITRNTCWPEWSGSWDKGRYELIMSYNKHIGGNVYVVSWTPGFLYTAILDNLIYSIPIIIFHPADHKTLQDTFVHSKV